jgi:hypothetical protein
VGHDEGARLMSVSDDEIDGPVVEDHWRTAIQARAEGAVGGNAGSWVMTVAGIRSPSFNCTGAPLLSPALSPP